MEQDDNHLGAVPGGPKSPVEEGLLVQQLVSVERVSLNISQSVVVTTEDKLRLCLQQHLSDIQGSREWLAPLSLLVSLLLTLASADFKDTLLPAATWHALFLISAGLSFLWLLRSLSKVLGNRSIDDLLSEIQTDSNGRSANDAKVEPK